MTDKEIIEKLVTEFMGWKFTDDVQVIGEHSHADITTTVWFRRPDENVGVAGAITCHDFDPLHDPAACALVLDELERREFKWEWECFPWPGFLDYSFRYWNWSEEGGGHADADNCYRAVCLAVLKACEATE